MPSRRATLPRFLPGVADYNAPWRPITIRCHDPQPSPGDDPSAARMYFPTTPPGAIITQLASVVAHDRSLEDHSPPMPRVNPEILRWARETAGLDLEEAAKKLDLPSARGLSPGERLAALETGDTEPSRPMLLRMAKQYHRPLLSFYLSTPPRSGSRGQDFRVLPEDYRDTDQAILDALLREFVVRQGLIRAAIEDEDEPTPLTFIGSASIDGGVDALVTSLRAALALPLAAFRAARDADQAFRLLRGRVEALGVFVILASNLGSHHTALEIDSFRGWALADPIAPFIVINDLDSRTAWSFTLLHEAAHLWLGYSGVSGGTPDRGIERFCNDVASEFLLPSVELREFTVERAEAADSLKERISVFAGVRHVSRSMVAYRLYRRRSINSRRWEQLREAFRLEWVGRRDQRRDVSGGKSTGPNYYVVRRHRLGDALLRTTARLLASGAITTTKAGQVLGVKPYNVQTLTAGTARTALRP
jgi:Zn-dependent peptidase ImmA (M78 family)/transcriptional regulator with XRE-family HTH domain